MEEEYANVVGSYLHDLEDESLTWRLDYIEQFLRRDLMRAKWTNRNGIVLMETNCCFRRFGLELVNNRRSPKII